MMSEKEFIKTTYLHKYGPACKMVLKSCFRGKTKTKTFSTTETNLQTYYKSIRKFCFFHELIQNDSILQLKLFRMNLYVFMSLMAN